MIYKLFTYLSLTSALLTTMNPCFAMEPEDSFKEKRQRGAIKKPVADASNPLEKRINQVELLQIENYIDRLENLFKMQNSPQKEAEFGKLVKELDSLGIETLGGDEMCKVTLQTCLAKALSGQGAVKLFLLNINDAKISLETRCEQLNQIAHVLRRSLQIYKPVQPAEASALLEQLTAALLCESTAYWQRTQKEKAGDTILDLYSAALKTAKEAYELNIAAEPDSVIQLVTWVLKKSSCYSLGLCHNIYNSTLPDDSIGLEKYKSLIKDANFLKKLINFIKQIHFITDNVLIGFNMEGFKNEVPSQKKGRGRAQQTKRATPPPNSNDIILPMWTTYCETLGRASKTISKVETDNILLKKLYKEKEEEHLSLAWSTYKAECYQGEYQNDPAKEEAFIGASLESFIGNGAPLKKFYSDLIQERRERREQAIVRQIKEQQDAMAQQIRAQEEQAMAQKNQEKPKKRSELAQHAEGNQTSLTELSCESSSSGEKTTEVKPAKIKKHGVADPSKAQGTPQEAPRSRLEVVEQEQPITILHPRQHQVFLSLIGESHDQNIKREEVLQLLCRLGCSKISGGKHGKITAPNRAEWTIPPEWDGPIYSCYRNQLRHFLQDRMELDRKSVRAKGN